MENEIQDSLFDDNPEYDAFVAKFERKKTADDCYTPPPVYAAVRDWVCRRYDIDPATIVRPFYPGGDYERFDYLDGCLVLDNPPFSILTAICKFYLARHIRFFLFAPSLRIFSTLRKRSVEMNHIICDAKITYENGAVVNTAFLTNLDDGIVAESAPDLGAAIADAQARTRAPKPPRYVYPSEVLTPNALEKLARGRVSLKIRKQDAEWIAALDAQKHQGKSLYGCGMLLSEWASADVLEAERLAESRAEPAQVWPLSEREEGIIQRLSEGDEAWWERYR